MALKLKTPEPTMAQVQAMAASGSSGVARRSQALLVRRKTAQLAKEMGR